MKVKTTSLCWLQGFCDKNLLLGTECGVYQHSAVSMDRTLVSSCFSGGPILEKMLHFFFALWMSCSLEIGFLCVILCFISITPLLRLQGDWWTCAHAGGAGVHVGGSSCGLQTGRRLSCCVSTWCGHMLEICVVNVCVFGITFFKRHKC